MRNNPFIAVGAGLVTALALGLLAGSTAAFPPRVAPGPHEEAGRLLARETLRCLGPGGQLTVITRDTSDFRQPAVDLLFSGFRRAVGKAGVKIAAVHALEVDPLRLVEVPSGDFMELIGKATAGSVIVSFLGPPIFTPEQRLQLGRIRPKIVAFCPGNLPAQIDLRQVFAQEVLDAAVVTGRPSPGAGASFQILTAANVAAFYASPGSASGSAAR